MDSPDDEINELMDEFKSVLSQTIHERDNRMHQENLQLRVQLQEQSRRIEKLEVALQEYQTRTFDSIPTEELSDATISEQYSVIREHISNWVECLPDVLEFERSFDQAMSESHHLFNGNYLSYRPDGVLECPSVAQVELFSSTIFQGLGSAVFYPYIMGAPRPHCILFDDLEREMTSLEVPKEEITSWRTNTIKAYISRPEYTNSVRNLRTMFHSNLRSFFSRFTFDENYNIGQRIHSFQEQIMNPALNLARGMNLSSQTYHWEWYKHFNKEASGLVYKRHFEQFIVYDIRTHNRVASRNDGASQAADQKPVARYLFTIYPALFRSTNGQYIQIEKATILATVVRDKS
ncbi:hypothetical protein ATEIFO6365_0004001200 [Aspergillus terreus]|uniref:Uncharacterized protein n=1 Tax=Aspergillus terreus TaxID=33178 RepID=A0A5M3YQE5_ASPTE|nr:hypothetical protein ATETN484_0002011100 [Aspergillus terreus]GFF14894.1 hypothetical protein ATEIFO6365_0004001200 [Aspergillus terreus]